MRSVSERAAKVEISAYFVRRQKSRADGDAGRDLHFFGHEQMLHLAGSGEFSAHLGALVGGNALLMKDVAE